MPNASGSYATPSGVEHRREAGADLRRADAAQVEALQAAEDRRGRLGDLLRLGGGEHEHHARRRLLEHLEERVPRLAREHVRLVDDVDLVAVLARRRVHGALAQLAASSTERLLAASISTTSIDAPPLQMRRQLVALAARLAVGRAPRTSQLSAIASTRASVVFPCRAGRRAGSRAPRARGRWRP
jgi:hypothetical protein